MAELRRDRLLVAEYDPELADALSALLESAGFEVHTERLGTAALSYAAQELPDLAILDVQLPDMNGYRLCRELRSLCQYWIVPVLMLGETDLPVGEVHRFSHGADAYLTKSCEVQDVLRAVGFLLGLSELCQEVRGTPH